MEPTVSIKETGKLEAKSRTAIIGLPDVGLAGSIAAFYIARKLELKEAAQLESDGFPLLIVHESKPKSPMRFYAGNDLITIVSEIPLEMPLFTSASDAILKYLSEKKASSVVVLGGIASETRMSVDKPKVYGMGSEASMDALIKKNNIVPFEEGAIMGANGAIIKACLKYEMPCLYLVADAYYRYPDPGSAAALIETMNTAYGLNVDLKELAEKAEEIRIATKDLMKKTERSLGESSLARGTDVPVMYR
jgi:uncharacterized protein